MAQRIEYANKRRGDLWTAVDANEVKDVVNSNATALENVAAAQQQDASNITTLATQITGLSQSIETPIVAQTATTVTINPNTLNVWGEVESLQISFASTTGTAYKEFMLQFTVDASNFTLTLPSTVIWIDNEEPDWETGVTYQVSIVNNLALYAGWEEASEE